MKSLENRKTTSANALRPLSGAFREEPGGTSGCLDEKGKAVEDEVRGHWGQAMWDLLGLGEHFGSH